MNLYDVEVCPDGFGVVEGTVWRVPVPGRRPGLMRLGLRPEELSFSSEEVGGSVEGLVRLVEPAGGVTDLTIGIGPVNVLVRTPGFANVGIGDHGWLDSSRAYSHLFERV